MVDLDDERDFMCIPPGQEAKTAESGGNRIASTFNTQLDNVLRIEIDGVFGKRSAAAMLNTLVNGKDGKVAAICQSPVIVHALEIAQHLWVSIGRSPDSIDEIGAGKM